jgi:group I intron endonuclease
MNIGIYKIISPSGKIYIGQSWDLKKRFNKYKNLNCEKQRKLFNSLVKYGFENHIVEIICEFNDDITQDILDQKEIYYINEYKNNGFDMLNLASGGSRGKHSEESKEKMRNRKGVLHPSYGKKRTKEFCEKIKGEGNANFGNKGEKNPNFGKKQTIERILKTSGENNYWYGKTGSTSPFFGIKQTIEQIEKKSGKNHKKSKKVIDTLTNKIYDTIGQAAKDLNLTYSTLVTNIRLNKSRLKYYK